MKKTFHITGSVARTLLGLVFIFSGFVKAVDPLGTTYKIEDYLKAFGGFFNYLLPAAEPAAWCLIAFEFVLGVSLLLNVKTNWTSWLALLLMLVLTPLTLYIAIENPVSDCGCFGDALVISNWATFWKNMALLTLVVVLLVMKKHVPPTWRWQAELGIFCIALVFVCCFMLYARLHLPVMDFRPYKIGNNLPELMEYPDDAEPDQYEVLFVYEQNGRQQTFTLDNYPKDDTTWVFVDQRSKLIKKGYEPPVHDFEIITLEGDDLTDDILTAPQAVLVIMYDLHKTDRNQADKLMAIIHEYPNVHFLTGSGEEDIVAFSEELGWDEETMMSVFCQTDPVTLKTIVRANPGVIVLEDGTVADKYNMRNK